MERVKFSGKRSFSRPWRAKGQSAGDTQSNDRREQQNLFKGTHWFCLWCVTGLDLCPLSVTVGIIH